jgi:crotonobetainyl-CoA:carnitine CoA-transferase CaiB-like acyl-CoA transferase
MAYHCTMKWLQDIRVIDLSTVLAGPSVASFLGELGADVIKYESPRFGGDVTRSWRLAGEQTPPPLSAYFASINFCKSYGTLDLMEPSDRSKLMEELKETDVLITNFKESDLAKFGLTPDTLRAHYPRLIHAQLRGFDSTPERVAYDVVLQAECGMMALNGSPEGEPTKFPIAIVDVLAAHQMKESILLALYQRERNGQGCVVRTSLEKSGLSSLVNQASNYMMTGMMPARMGSQHPNIAPYGDIFECADHQWVVLAIGSDRQFNDLCTILGIPELSKEERFASNPQRVIHRKELHQEMAAAFQSVTSQPFMQSCIDHQIPAGMIRTMDAVVNIAKELGMVHSEAINQVPTSRMSSLAFELINHT